MRFTPDFLDEIKARLPVSEVVRRRVQLKKAGREWKGLSPFSSEKTPSFFVNDQKMAWFDFSSGQNGNIFDFVMRVEGLSFPEAVERLAGEAGLALPEASPQIERRERARAGLHDALEHAAAFFEAALQAPGGARARGYLADRGVSAPLQRQFRVGFAPAERFALRDHLAERGVSRDIMIEAGLLIHGEDVAVPYDRFRDRVMFPIADRAGRTIAFGGRALDPDAPAKYLNSPETPLFHKGATLYNHHQARKPAHECGLVVAVEGYVDVIAASGAGFPHVVAPLGTALTPEQLGLLWRLAEEPALCFDGDAAGRKAAYRAIDTALPLLGPGRTLRFAFLPDGKDPDDLIRSAGAAAFGEAIEAARPLVDVLWAREAEAGPLDTPERRAAFERRLGDQVRAIRDETLRRYYGREMRARLDAAFASPLAPAPQRRSGAYADRPYRSRRPEPARSGFLGAPAQASADLKRSALLSPRQSRRSPREGFIALLIANHPDVAARHVEDLASLEFEDRDMARLRDAVLHALAGPIGDLAAVRAEIEVAGLGPARERLDATLGAAGPPCLRVGGGAEDAEDALRQALVLHRHARALHRELKIAENALLDSGTAEDAARENLERLRDIQTELASVEGREASLDDEAAGLSAR